MFGFLVIDKPKGITSHDVVSKLRRILKIKQIGHSGTLDPMATGVLPIAIGKATRLIEYLSDEKEYVAKLEFGKVSDSYDSDGNIEIFSDKKVNLAEIETFVANFIGEIEQIPPAYSAVHYNGERLYELARKGIIPDDIPIRIVKVNYIEILDFDFNTQVAEIKISCEKGTYIRSIIHDLGQLLGSGAIMTNLVRTRSSNFSINNAIVLNEQITDLDLRNKLINPIDVLLYNQKSLTSDEFAKIKNGNSVLNSEFEENSRVLLKNNDELVAVGEVKGSIIKVCKVLV